MSGKGKAFFFLVVMYGLGVATGMLWKGRRGHHDIWTSPHFVERRVKKLTAKLHLSADQTQAVRTVVEKTHERGRKAHEQMNQELALIHRDSMKSISQVLKPEQMADFEKMHQKFHARHKDMPADDLK